MTNLCNVSLTFEMTTTVSTLRLPASEMQSSYGKPAKLGSCSRLTYGISTDLSSRCTPYYASARIGRSILLKGRQGGARQPITDYWCVVS